MLALIYLVLAIYLGDLLSRRFYRFVSVAHRAIATVITALLIGAWFTYLAGLLSARARQLLLWGNALFFTAAIPAVGSNEQLFFAQSRRNMHNVTLACCEQRIG
jgi:low temperature requirement protein LtrA